MRQRPRAAQARDLERVGLSPHASQRATLARGTTARRWKHARPHDRDRREHRASTRNGGERHLDVADAREQDAATDDVVRHDRERPDG